MFIMGGGRVQSRMTGSFEQQSDDQSNLPHDLIKDALLIRETENRFLTLFSQGKLFGTVHTCVGQEFSALAFAGQLLPGDFVFSNHRCHGHFLAFTGNLEGLIAELLGRSTGVCGGVGGSQHLCHGNFFSNGIQGGIVPVAVGMAWAKNFQGGESIGVVYIGDGTLGEGVVYEGMNLASVLGVPLLFVCEDNGIAQSTPTERTISGTITDRAAAFGIPVWTGTTDEPVKLMEEAARAISEVRERRSPGFFHVKTARLNAHSKGDDERPSESVDRLRARDPLNRFILESPEISARLLEEGRRRIDAAVEKAERAPVLALGDYLPRTGVSSERNIVAIDSCEQGERLVHELNGFLESVLRSDPGAVIIGEDISDPYGGAFKVTKGLAKQYPRRVISTPISEAGITGFANGLALEGMRPWLEIMFGDFSLLALDQIVNHASKFHHMYNRQKSCPLVVRLPMGGGRGYGPTHSQSLEKLLCGIEETLVVAINSWLPPAEYLEPLKTVRGPAIVIEHKLDYGRRIGIPQGVVEAMRSSGEFPFIRARFGPATPILTVATYGGMASVVAGVLDALSKEFDAGVEMVVVSRIHPFDFEPVADSVAKTGRLVFVEEGNSAFGIGAEAISCLVELGMPLKFARRLGAAPVAIPSNPQLESQCIPTKESLTRSLRAIIQICR